ncbi:PQQ-dependent sugar dehydrogenase [Aquidulcibacter sp.]|uniref:PQQ-dependent sugar dehydrogenase n=1 Tax=Aquidulcibacter sp. TaxID=2052990 RepID=UPI0025C194B8|nr:PQQ-dependent sugar dehydrogenase [Aquidulcibacter sp.]MCA3693278.1 PQQ-dependent sugar dehydrogenase [Aquidulcibacter sp.]
MKNHCVRFLIASSLVIAASCAPAAKTTAPAAAAPQTLKVTEIASGLGFPWGAAVLPDGSILVTERDGRLRLIRDGKLVEAPITGVPAVLNDGQGGLFDVALHPDFATNRLVYLSFAKGTKSSNHTAVIRGTFDGTALTNVEPVFDAVPERETQAHFGGRLLFLPDKTLIVTLGDGYKYRDKAQDLSSDLGKIVRITDTGAPAPGNPFIGQAGKRAEIYSYGHRNVQGIARDPASGTLYAHEHGPKGGDEVNVLQPGKNYGWPVITYGVDYSGAPISLESKREGMEQPLVYWVPSIAPSSMVFYTGDLFPQWKGDLLVTALAGQQIRRIDLENGAVKAQETLLTEREERYRAMVQAPDGSLIVLTDDPEGKVLRLSPN